MGTANGLPFQIGGGQPLRDRMSGMLADLLEPPLPHPQEEWVVPPDVVDWGEQNFIDPVKKDLVRLADYQKRILRKTFEMIWAHDVITVLWSEIKKSGKTTVAGLVGAYWANNVEPPNEIISIANDEEQAAGRIYAAMTPTLERLGWNVPEKMPYSINPASGTVAKAISTNYAGEAGGNYGLTLWSELWCYTKESRKRLWEEMTPVPTRRYSVRWVETYAGFKAESELLWGLYCRAFLDGEIDPETDLEKTPLGQRVEGLEDLPVWWLPEYKMLVYWSHEPRMPWQTPEFIAFQSKDARPLAYRRHWRNHWVVSEDIFIQPEQWDALEPCQPLGEPGQEKRRIVLGADASEKNDSTSLVAATYDEKRMAPDILACDIWEPAPDASGTVIVDLTETIGKKLVWYLDNYDVVGIFYDPFQLHSIMTDLKKKYDRTGIRKLFIEFPQGSGRVLSDKALYDWIINKQLRCIQHEGLRKHVLNAAVKESERGFRLDKQSALKGKIDAAVAASEACYGASIKVRPKRKFVSVATARRSAEPQSGTEGNNEQE